MTSAPFFTTMAGRLWLLGMLLLDVFVLPVLLADRLLPSRSGDVFFAITMVVALLASGGARGRRRRLVVFIAFAAFAVQFVRFADHWAGLVILDASLSALAMATFAILVVLDVFRKEPAADRIIDVILAYLLVAATYAFVYEALNVAQPGSLQLNGGTVVHAADYVYFSLSTLTSVGFGDVLPRNPLMRAIAMSEALTGQLYVAVLIARFVNTSSATGNGGRERPR